MAGNRIYESSRVLNIVAADPTTPASGDPVRWGQRIGVALNDEDADGNTVADFGPAVYDLSVKGVNDSGNSAVAAGDALFYVDADTPKISKKSSGYFVGFALEAVGSGSTATIQVALVDSPGSGTLGSGTVGTTNLAAGAVTDEKLAGNLAVGFIPLPLTSFRLISSNDIPASGAGDGGTPSQDTDPKLERVNDATDKQLRLAWAANSVIEVQTQFAYPPDLDDAAAVEVHLLALMAGATDTPVIAVGYFEGVGDTNAGGNTAALSSSLAEKTVSIAAGDVGAAPKVATVTLTPGAHANDALYVLAAWIEYTRAD